MSSFPEETLLFPSDLTPAEQADLQETLREDPALAEAFRQAQALRAQVRARLEKAGTGMPGRRMLVCHALACSGHAGALTPGERALADTNRARLDAVIAAHPALADVVRRIQADADAFEAAWAGLAEAAPAPPRRTSRAFGRTDRAAQPADRSARRALRYAARTGVALTALLFLTVAGLLMQRDRALVTVETGVGEMREVTLAGGSVRLMEGSRLVYVHPDRRPLLRARTQLEGAAYFDVEPSDRGLRIETPTALTSVLGTTFGLRASRSETEVIVEDGVVTLASLEAPGQPVRVRAGERSRAALGGLPTTPQPAALEEALAWAGVTAFRATPLPRAVERLAEVFGVAARFDESLASEAVSGTFFAEDDPADAFQTLALALGAKVVETETGLLLTR